jgi:hypothetical protein
MTVDVDATYAIMTDESNTLDERAVAATDLLVWLVGDGWKQIMASDVADECRSVIFKALDHLAELEG